MTLELASWIAEGVNNSLQPSRLPNSDMVSALTFTPSRVTEFSSRSSEACQSGNHQPHSSVQLPYPSLTAIYKHYHKKCVICLSEIMKSHRGATDLLNHMPNPYMS